MTVKPPSIRLISGGEILTLDPTDGIKTIAKAKTVLKATYIDPNFKSWGLVVKSKSTGSMKVAVYETIRDTEPRKVFDCFSNKRGVLCLTQEQIIQFVKNYREWLLVGGVTFFVFKVGRVFFMVDMFIRDDGSLEVGVSRFWDNHIFPATFPSRVVIPQLNLEI